MELANLFYTPKGCLLILSSVSYLFINCFLLYKLVIKGDKKRSAKKMLMAFIPFLMLGIYEEALYCSGISCIFIGNLSVLSVKLFICSSFFVFIFFQSAGFVNDRLLDCFIYQTVLLIALASADLCCYLFGQNISNYVLLLSGIALMVTFFLTIKFFRICLKRFDTMIQVIKKDNFAEACTVFLVGLCMSYITLIALFSSSVVLEIISFVMIVFLHFVLLYKEYKGSSGKKVYRMPRTENMEKETLMEGLIVDEYKIIQRLILYFESHKPYLNKDLKLADVSKQIYTNRTYLSRALNQRLSKNFNQFVNYYRVKEACNLFLENPLIKINEMSMQSGFKSLSSFTTAFSLNMRYTPAEWCKEVKRRLNNNEDVCIEDYFK